ncbi:hypothetical protein M422DRAFT_273162 [Sphaerobolus stellatus SS14]|uniref:Uncharacterized protein n=1 Tax=Sphaerobolus stellatus (strain SS14) TaxID=990650 RepID=A0A0C9UKQ7_SPHS4|nr:hypothetical protein M422DRAFT_273162 [Sphaerobolus stellatus SS14]
MAKDAWALIGAPRPFNQGFKFVTSFLLSPLVLGVISLLFALYTLAALLVIFILAAKAHTANSPQLWLHLIFLLILLIVYLAVVYIEHATQGGYAYFFLDLAEEKGKVAIYVLAIAVVEFIIFFIVKGICWLKNSFFSPIPDT